MKKIRILFVCAGIFIAGLQAFSVDAAVKPKAKTAVKKPAISSQKPTAIPVKPALLVSSEVQTLSVAPVSPPAPLVNPKPIGIFGWGLKNDLTFDYTNCGQGFFGTLGARLGFIYDDPLNLGMILGLDSNSLKYKAGFGAVSGKDIDDLTIRAFPVYLDAMLTLPTLGIWGFNSFIGGGLNYTLYGTGRTNGNIGGQVYCGIYVDFGMDLGKTGIAFGFDYLRAGLNENGRTVRGFSWSLIQPFSL